MQDTGEEGDDGDTTSLDGCSTVCVLEGESVASGDLIVSEILINPIDVVDGLGEWFEFVNTTDKILSLDGVVIQLGSADEVQEFPLPVGLTLAGGEALAVVAVSDPGLNGGIANGQGFGNDAEIPNTGTPVVRLLNAEGVVDEVSFGPGFSWEAGVSLSLDPEQFSSSANDTSENWCAGTSPYGTTGNLGTPGVVNPACPFCGDGVCGASETCDGCPVDCGACTTGCVVSEEPGCGGCPCESAACDLEPLCCTDSWSEECVAICEFLELCPAP